MRSSTLFGYLATVATTASAKTIWATPHDSYSSSVGVLGCKINTDRVAYWPEAIDCTNICVKVSRQGRSVHLLRIDQSGGAYDMSYDAWNYLMTGESATKKPFAGGAEEMEYEDAPVSQCKDIIKTKDKKLALSAANSMNFLSACLADKNSWVAKNYALWNIMDPLCTLGVDEECTLDLAVSNQAKCPSQLGVPTKLTSQPVYNIRYPTGERVKAGVDLSANVPVASGATRKTAQLELGRDWQALDSTLPSERGPDAKRLVVPFFLATSGESESNAGHFAVHGVLSRLSVLIVLVSMVL